MHADFITNCPLALCLNFNIACDEEQTIKIMKRFHNCTSQEDKTLNQLLTCKKLTQMPTPMLQTGILGLDLTRHLLHLLKLSMHLNTSNPGHK